MFTHKLANRHVSYTAAHKVTLLWNSSLALLMKIPPHKGQDICG